MWFSFFITWEQRKLGDMGKTFTGLSGKSSVDFGHGDGRFVTYMNVFTNPIANPDMVEPIEIDSKQSAVKCGDILFTTSSETPEEVGMSSIWLENTPNTYLNSFCFGFRPLIEIDSAYMAYALRSETFRKKMILLAQGISRYNISKNRVMEIELSLPSMAEQKQIGACFLNLDNLITLHQRKGKYIFCPCFWIFRPLILPITWEQREFKTLAKTRRGLTYNPNSISHNGIRVLRSSNINEDTFILSDEDVFVRPDVVKIESVKANDILITAANGSTRLVGKHAIIAGIRENEAVHGGFMLVASSTMPYFVNAAMSAPWYLKFISLFVAGGNGAIGNLNKNDLDSQILFVPRQSEQERIGGFFRNLDNLITLHQCKEKEVAVRTGVPAKTLNERILAYAWEQRKFGELYRKVSRKNDLTYGETDIISVANMYYKVDSYITDNSYLLTYNVFHLGDIAFEGNKSKDFAHGRFVENTIGNGIVSHVFDVFEPIMASYDLMFWKYAINNERLMGPILVRSTKASTMMTNLVADDFLQEKFMLPSFEEQKLIGQLLFQVDNLITLHQCKERYFLMGDELPFFTFYHVKNTSTWEQRKLGEIFERIVRKNTNNESSLPLTISAQDGLVDQITYFNNRVASRDVSNYYLVLNGEFAYNKSTSDGYPFGAVKRLDLYEKGVLSTLYIVFALRDLSKTDSDYIAVFFDTDRWHRGVAERAAEGARNHGLLNISANDFFDISISLPCNLVEQQKIGIALKRLDNLITLHQRGERYKIGDFYDKGNKTKRTFL